MDQSLVVDAPPLDTEADRELLRAAAVAAAVVVAAVASEVL